MEGRWGWLGVLRQAELGMTVLMWSDAYDVFSQADFSFCFHEENGGLWLSSDTPSTHLEMAALDAGKLVARDGACMIDGYVFGAGEKVLHPTYAPNRVDWVGVSVDGAGIVADLLTLGAAGRFVNAAELGDVGGVLGKATDLGGLAWGWGPWAVETTAGGFSWNASTYGLCLDVAGMVSPVPIWADAASIAVSLFEGYQMEP